MILRCVRLQVPTQCGSLHDNGIDALLSRNYWNSDFANQIAFAATTTRPHSVTADRVEFLGRNRSPSSPAALGRVRLSGQVRPLVDPCAAIMVPLEVAPGSEGEVVFFLGQAGGVEDVQRLVDR